MTPAELSFFQILTSEDEVAPTHFADIPTQARADIYIMAHFLQIGLEIISDNLRAKTDFQPLLTRQLQTLHFLTPLLLPLSQIQLKKMKKTASLIMKFCLMRADANFARRCCEALSHLNSLEVEAQALSILCTGFSELDVALGITYKDEQSTAESLVTDERIFVGSEKGVQSSYHSLVNVVELIPKTPLTLIDLGSGYGRLGLVAGLLRPNIKAIGYEFSPYRVEVSNAAAHSLHLDSRIKYFEQDLSSKKFEIPMAEIYYLYDPFTDATYLHVIEQLLEIGKSKAVTIIARGAARESLSGALTKNVGWTADFQRDEQTMAVFQS